MHDVKIAILKLTHLLDQDSGFGDLPISIPITMVTSMHCYIPMWERWDLNSGPSACMQAFYSPSHLPGAAPKHPARDSHPKDPFQPKSFTAGKPVHFEVRFPHCASVSWASQNCCTGITGVRGPALPLGRWQLVGASVSKPMLCTAAVRLLSSDTRAEVNGGFYA